MIVASTYIGPKIFPIGIVRISFIRLIWYLELHYIVICSVVSIIEVNHSSQYRFSRLYHIADKNKKYLYNILIKKIVIIINTFFLFIHTEIQHSSVQSVRLMLIDLEVPLRGLIPEIYKRNFSLFIIILKFFSYMFVYRIKNENTDANAGYFAKIKIVWCTPHIIIINYYYYWNIMISDGIKDVSIWLKTNWSIDTRTSNYD